MLATPLAQARLSEVCALVTDGTHDTPKRVREGFPLIKAKEIVGGKIDFDGCDQISLADHLGVIARSKPEKGDTLFAHIGASLGEAAYVGTDRPFSIKNIALFKPDPSKIDGRYLYYLVISPEFQALAKAARTGSAQPFLSLEHLRAHRIRFHQDINDQRRIASILGAYDDLIEVNRRRIALLEEMARRLFEEWFVQFRFPGHAGQSMVETPNGLIPHGWHYVRLDEVANVNADTIRPVNAPDRIGYVDIASVVRGDIQAVEWQAFANAPGRARRRVRDGSIIWSTVRPNRRSHALILDPEDNLIVSTGFSVLDPYGISSTYLYHYVTTDAFVGYLVNNATGAAYPAVTGATFERALVLLPPGQLVQKFGLIAKPMMRLMDTLRRENIRAAASRDLLLPHLISGELSVSTAERELEAVA